jgi:5-bromo-4-chloroindolyl phosphate hydrolysis protein
VRIDGQLGHWTHLEERVEKALLEQEESTTEGFKYFKNNVETVRAKIERKQH